MHPVTASISIKFCEIKEDIGISKRTTTHFRISYRSLDIWLDCGSFIKGGGVPSNLGCRDTFLKIVSLLKNYRSEWGKSIHFWKALCTGFS